ncbi:MAG TPA: hydantoinase/oxoprolinase family protein [Streptosporangiaceae bacterium]|nr:hydantoinase/oxoprolinase family protein [Streptosporangiaceae bacterium]
MTRLINIDNGGTLTDFCLVDGGEVRYTKTLTTPYDLSRCLFDGLGKVSELLYSQPRLAALLQSTDYIRYSTTQGTNALVQRAGPRLGLLLTDSTLIEGLAATQAQEDLLGALVGDRWAVVSLDNDDEALSRELVARVNDLSARGARRLVVAVTGEDGAGEEDRIKSVLLRLYPRHLLGAVPLLFSWELVADPDDVRRTWSSLLNAFLHPAMELFLFNADKRLRDARARQPLRIFRNDGGSSRVSKSAALKTYSSGPRGGLEGTRALASQYGLRHVVMVDVGGTTTDIGVVTDGTIHVDRRGLIDHAPSSLELAAITSYGIGGSSVFRVAEGQIRLGPDSVGAAPGPACFGLGGDEATITDVLLLTGLLEPATYLEGTLELHPDRSATAIERKIAKPLALSVDEALRRMQDAHAGAIAEALAATTTVTEDTVIAAFGGAGPMTVCAAARKAGARYVLIPRMAAVFSAFGMGFSDLSQHYEQPLPAADHATIDAVSERLLQMGARDLYAEGVDPSRCTTQYRITVERDDTEAVIDLDDPHDAAAHLRPGDRASLELVLLAPLPHVTLGRADDTPATPARPSGHRRLRDSRGGTTEAPVYLLLSQPPGAQASGPAVIEGPFFTMLVPGGWQFDTTATGDLRLTDKGL